MVIISVKKWLLLSYESNGSSDAGINTETAGRPVTQVRIKCNGVVLLEMKGIHGTQRDTGTTMDAPVVILLYKSASINNNPPITEGFDDFICPIGRYLCEYLPTLLIHPGTENINRRLQLKNHLARDGLINIRCIESEKNSNHFQHLLAAWRYPPKL